MSTSPEEIDLNLLQDALAGVWSIERQLGRGGMATVFLAREVSLDRPVALKVLHPTLSRDPDARERFLREARTGAKLSHPNIVPIYAVETKGEFVYFVMGLVDGETLGERIRREGPVRPDEAQHILREVGWALSYAHAMGLVHRDVTLENILIERSTGRAVLADFGIAAEVARDGEGPLLGTPAYLAPEVIQGENATPQSDLYALGVVAWSMLSGRPPFLGESNSEVLLKHLSEPTPSLAAAAPGTPSRIVRAVEGAMAKEPATRSQGVEHWLSLFEVEAADTVLAKPLRGWLRGWETVRPFYALGAMYVAMTASGYSLLQWNDQGWGIFTHLYSNLRMVIAVVLLVHIGARLSQLRKAVRAGYGATDLQLAVIREREELRRIPNRRAPFLGQFARWLRWFCIAIAIGLMTQVNSKTLHDWGGYESGMARLVYFMSSWSIKIVWISISFNFLVPAYLLRPDGIVYRLRTKFWGTGIARGLLRAVAFGLPKARATEETLHRPTELVLDLAIEDLWHALPRETRKRLGGVPKLVESLRRKVSDLKGLTKLIEDSAGRLTPEIVVVRDQMLARQEAGLSALERLRLMLGKLGGASGTVGDFSQQLANAREVEQELLMELGAHHDLRKLLKRRSGNGDPRSEVSGLTPAHSAG